MDSQEPRVAAVLRVAVAAVPRVAAVPLESEPEAAGPQRELQIDARNYTWTFFLPAGQEHCMVWSKLDS